MKLFEFWTELPASIISMFPELSDELNQFSQMISQWSKKILIAQELVVGQLNKIEINDLSSEALDSLQRKLQLIEKEKANLAIQGIKATTKILSEAGKYLESLDFPSKDNMTQLKLTLKVTRTIKDKIIIEQADLKLNNENCSLPDNNCCSSTTNSNSPVNPNIDNSTDIDGFLEMLTNFVDKIQSKLFSKSNQLISLLGKCSLSASSNEQETNQPSYTSPNLLSNKIPNFEVNLSNESEKESSFEANRNILNNIKKKESRLSKKIYVSRKNTSSSIGLSEKKDECNKVMSSSRMEKRKKQSKIVLKKKGKKTSMFSYRTTGSSDSTSDNNSQYDLEKSHSEEPIQITNFRTD